MSVLETGKGDEDVEWNVDNSAPIYLQLLEQLQLRIIAGVYQPGQQLPAVRELAAEAGVNPNTMQKALAELERLELAYSRRTSGRFITEDEDRITALRKQLAMGEVRKFTEKMQKLGFTKDAILAMITESMDA